MQRFKSLSSVAFLGAVLAAASVSGCFQAPYGDAGADRPEMPEMFFNVGASGTDTCPGNLFASASEGRARCNNPPQHCVLPGGSTGVPLQCDCAGTAGMTGNWSCRSQ